VAAVRHVSYAHVGERQSFGMPGIEAKKFFAYALWGHRSARCMQELVGGYFEEPAIEVDFAAVSRGFDPGGACRVKDLGRTSSRSSLL
jgi:hypothetical protein